MDRSNTSPFIPNLSLEVALNEMPTPQEGKLPYHIIMSDYAQLAADNRELLLDGTDFCSAYMAIFCQHGAAGLSQRDLSLKEEELKEQHDAIINKENGDLQKLKAIKAEQASLQLRQTLHGVASALNDNSGKFNAIRNFLSHVGHDFSRIALTDAQQSALEQLYAHAIGECLYSSNTLVCATAEEDHGIRLFKRKDPDQNIPTLAGTLFLFSFLLAKGQMNRLLDQTPGFKVTRHDRSDGKSAFNERRKAFTFCSPADSLVMEDDFVALNAYVHLVNLRKTVPHELVARNVLSDAIRDSFVDREADDIILARNSNPKTSFLLDYLEDETKLSFCRRQLREDSFKARNKFVPIYPQDDNRQLPYWIINDNVACFGKGQRFRVSRNQVILMAVARMLGREIDAETFFGHSRPEKVSLSPEEVRKKVASRIEHIRNLFSFDENIAPGVKRQRLQDDILRMCERHIYQTWGTRKEGASPNVRLADLARDIESAVAALQGGNGQLLHALVDDIAGRFETRKREIEQEYADGFINETHKMRLVDKINRIILPFFQGIKRGSFDDVYGYCRFEANKSAYFKRITRAIQFGKDERKREAPKGIEAPGKTIKRVADRIQTVSKDWNTTFEALVNIDLWQKVPEQEHTVTFSRKILSRMIGQSKLFREDKNPKWSSVSDLFKVVSRKMRQDIQKWEKRVNSSEFLNYLQGSRTNEAVRFTGMLDAIGLSRFVPHRHVSEKGRRRQVAREGSKTYAAWNIFQLAKRVLFPDWVGTTPASQTIHILETIYRKACEELGSSSRYDGLLDTLRQNGRQYAVRKKVLFLALEDVVLKKLEERYYSRISEADRTEDGLRLAYAYVEEQGVLKKCDRNASGAKTASILLANEQLGAFDRVKLYARPKPEAVLGLLHSNGRPLDVPVSFAEFEEMQQAMRNVRQDIIGRLWELERAMVNGLNGEKRKKYSFNSFQALVKAFIASNPDVEPRLQPFTDNLILLRNAMMHNQPLCSVNSNIFRFLEGDAAGIGFSWHESQARHTLRQCEGILMATMPH